MSHIISDIGDVSQEILEGSVCSERSICKDLRAPAGARLPGAMVLVPGKECAYSAASAQWIGFWLVVDRGATTFDTTRVAL